MTKSALFFGCAMLFFSCSDDAAETPSKRGEQLESDIDFPNENTRIEYLETFNDPKNEGIISRLISDLKGDKFELEKLEIHPLTSFYDPDDEVQIVMRGNGMKAYSFKRTEAKPKYYYPDFYMSVYEFKTEGEASACIEKLNAAFKGGRFPNGKQPNMAVQNRKEVFHLSTRAEMFRGYIEDCVKRIEGYSE